MDECVKIIKDMIKVIEEWNDEPTACGCDTFTCKGTCLPAVSRDVVEKARKYINNIEDDV